MLTFRVQVEKGKSGKRNDGSCGFWLALTWYACRSCSILTSNFTARLYFLEFLSSPCLAKNQFRKNTLWNVSFRFTRCIFIFIYENDTFYFIIFKVFPDHFHLSTLHEFLDACSELHADVKVKNIMVTLIEHLALYAVADESPGIPEDVNLFEIFSEHAEKMIDAGAQMVPEDVVSIQVSSSSNFPMETLWKFFLQIRTSIFLSYGEPLLNLYFSHKSMLENYAIF